MIGSSVSARKFNFYVTIRNTLISLKRHAVGLLFCLTHKKISVGKNFVYKIQNGANAQQV